MSVCGGDVLLELFQNHGIEYIFCSPGSEWVPVWEGLAKRYSHGESNIKYINCRHEILAVSAATGYSKATGQLTAVLLHANFGPLLGAMAIRAAQWARAPVIICSSYTSDYGEDGGGVGRQSHWLSFMSDIGGPSTLVRSFVKWSNTVTSKETLIDSIIRGCQIAQTDPLGPVFIAIPKELILKSLPGTKIPSSASVLSRAQPHYDDLEEIARQLLASKQPIIITEHVGENPEAVTKMAELAELLSIPVFEGISPVFANFPKNHPLHQGYDATEALNEADTILIIGAITPWYPPSAFPQNSASTIVLDDDPLRPRLPYYGYQNDLVIGGDIKQSLAELVNIVRNHIKGSDYPVSIYQERLERYKTKHNQMVEDWISEAHAEKSNKPISPKWFYYVANKLLPSNSISIIETVTHTRYAYRYLTGAKRYFRTNGGGLGIGLGIAIGTKLAYRDTPVIYHVGDGSFNYNPVLAGLGLCQEYQLPIMTIILNNGSYAAMRIEHQTYFPNGWAATRDSYIGVDILPRPDYTKVAEAFNMHTERLEDPNSIEPALKSALQNITSGKPALLDVIMK